MMNEWQPIETAPKDGTHILGWCKRYGAIEVWWFQDMHYYAGWMDSGDSEPEPSHWMPLPTLPSRSCAIGEAPCADPVNPNMQREGER